MLTVDEAITFQIANNNGIDEQKPASVCQHVIRTVKTLELPANMNSESKIRALNHSFRHPSVTHNYSLCLPRTCLNFITSACRLLARITLHQHLLRPRQENNACVRGTSTNPKWKGTLLIWIFATTTLFWERKLITLIRTNTTLLLKSLFIRKPKGKLGCIHCDGSVR